MLLADTGATTSTNTTSPTYMTFMDGANHRGNFTEVDIARRFVLKHLFGVKLRPQAGLTTCTKCTLSTTKRGRYKHIYILYVPYNIADIYMVLYLFTLARCKLRTHCVHYSYLQKLTSKSTHYFAQQ
jgi:hypothetical protein